MSITHAIRGDDHVNNTPRQINLFHALGVAPPAYGHLPMINGQDGAKLSKRHGAVNVLEYREMGFLPEALLNYLLRLGWSHGDQEIFTSRRDDRAIRSRQGEPLRGELRSEEALVGESAAHLEDAELPTRGVARAAARAPGARPENGPPLELAVEALRERSQTLVEMAERARCYYEEYEDFDATAAKTHLQPAARPILEALRDAFAALDDWSREHDAGRRRGRRSEARRQARQGRAAAARCAHGTERVARHRHDARSRRPRAYAKENRAGARLYRLGPRRRRGTQPLTSDVAALRDRSGCGQAQATDTHEHRWIQIRRQKFDDIAEYRPKKATIPSAAALA